MAAADIIPAHGNLANPAIIYPNGHIGSAAIIAFRIGTGAPEPILWPPAPKGAIVCQYDPHTRMYRHPDGREIDNSNLYEWAEELRK
jgi:hypothetical protein